MLECSQCGSTYPDRYYFKDDGRTSPLICQKCSEAVREKALTNLPFNLSAAFLTIIWSFGHSMIGLGLVLLFANIVLSAISAFVPVLGLIAWAGTTLGFGFAGSGMIFRDRGYTSLQEFKTSERGWQIAGGIAGVVQILLFMSAIGVVVRSGSEY